MTEQMPFEREDLVDVFYIPFVRHVLPAGRSFSAPSDRAIPARLDSKPQNSRRSPGGTKKESPAGQGGALGAKRGQRLFVAAIHKARMTGWPLPALQKPSLDSGKPVDSFCLLGR